MQTDALSATFSALADPTRRLLLRWLSVCRQEGREKLQRVVAPDRP